MPVLSSSLGLLSVVIIFPSRVLMMYWELHPASARTHTRNVISGFIACFASLFTLTTRALTEV